MKKIHAPWKKWGGTVHTLCHVMTKWPHYPFVSSKWSEVTCDRCHRLRPEKPEPAYSKRKKVHKYVYDYIRTRCHVENKTWAFKGTDSWRYVTCEKCRSTK